MVKVLSRNIIRLPDVSFVDDDIPVLVFEPDRYGYKAAIQWLEKNKPTSYYRCIVPLDDKHVDVGDALVDGQESIEYKPVYRYATLKVELIKDPLVDGRNEKDWPFRTQHRLLDFQLALKAQRDYVILPDAVTGLSIAQDSLLAFKDMKDDEAIAIVCTRYDLDKPTVRGQWELLHQGNRPAILHEDPYHHLPRLVLNGSYPIDLSTVVDALKTYIQYGKLPEWRNISSSHGSVSYCKTDEDGFIVEPPYGVSVRQYQKDNIAWCMSTLEKPFRYEPEAEHHQSKTLVWDGRTRQRVFHTIDEYIKWWIQDTHKRMTTVLEKWEQEEEYDVNKREFIRNIYADTKFNDEKGRQQRCFIDETIAQKRARIIREYAGHEEFLDIPIKEISEEFIFDKAPKNMESARDVWESLLN